MNESWKNTVVTEIGAAVYVAPGAGTNLHKNRPYHGFVVNDAGNSMDYRFEDGKVLHTEGLCLFYLPKGSTYTVEPFTFCGCHAINFEADIADEPFAIPLKRNDELLHAFKAAIDASKKGSGTSHALAMRAVYDAIYRVQKELSRQYVTGAQTELIAPATNAIRESFTDGELSVRYLAELCGISEVYLRRLFLRVFGVSPKEYIVKKRIEYAKSLLRSGDFSVSAVAALCGYSEPCHFSREFTRRVGVAPSQYLVK